MKLEEELIAVESVVQAALHAATEHYEDVKGIQQFDEEPLAHYKNFLDSTISRAESTLVLCRRIASTFAASGASVDDSAALIQELIMGVLESVQVTYGAMGFVEHLTTLAVGSRSSEVAAKASACRERCCSFCGKEAKVVAGPVANICAGCTRLACAVLGIDLQDTTR